MSLDGFVAGPKDEGDWIFQASTPDSREWLAERLSQVGAHAAGTRTFANWIGYWPTATGPFAEPMNAIPKVLFSRTGTLPAANPAANESWQNARIASGPLADEIAKLKAEGGAPIGVAGGAALAQALVRENLVDEYQLVVHPIALGAGKSLFPAMESRLLLQLVDQQRFSGGIVALTYRRR